MTGEQFKSLDIESMIKYINSLLSEGDSVDNIRMTLGVGKNYIANTFKKYGYQLDRNINQYVNATNVITDTTRPIEKPKKTTNTNTKDDRYKALEGQIKDLQNQINSIMDILDNNTIATNVITDTTSIIHKDISKYDTKDTVNRNYRVYTDIQEELATFCKAHKQHKVQDIVSSALREYLDKYNK